LEDVAHDDILAGYLLHSSVISQDDHLLVSSLALLQLLELLFFGIVITDRDDSNNKNSEKDRGAFDPPVLKAVIDNANDQ
jgi:hypothetical protein